MNSIRLTLLVPVFVFAAAVVITGTAGAAPAGETAILTNGGFETVHNVALGPDGKVAGWKLDAQPRVPTDWQLNAAYPGQLAVSSDRPHGGERFVRLTAPANGSCHLYQMCRGLKADRWYRVSCWARGGLLAVQTYDYYKQGATRGQMLVQTRCSGEWQQFVAFFRPSGEGYERSALAVTTAAGQSVDVDDVSVEALALPEMPTNAPDLTFENEAARISISPSGVLTHLICKASGKDYAATDMPRVVLTAQRHGVITPAYLLTRNGDVVTAQFIDPSVKATLRITPDKRHFAIEVLSIQPQDVDELDIAFPLRRLKTVGTAFDSTYGSEFGACFFGTTVNTLASPASEGRAGEILRCGCFRAHGIVGAKFSLVATPFSEFKPAIMEAERDSGLPCPMRDGKWLRDSDSVHKSYLFATDASEANIDTLIKYAKLGGFGTIIFLKDNWLRTHGHYEINTDNFPHGLDSLKAAVVKIHAAGLEAGVHVFGPSISPNDPYVTPRPDDRLAAVSLPPLAAAVDAKSTTLTLTGTPDFPPHGPQSMAFPGSYLRIGDEIVRFGSAEPGLPYRYTGCQRGALGTQASAHPAGSEVRGMLTMWGYFLVDPDSTLADEMTQHFADIVNACHLDMVYIDASDGIVSPYIDRWYYLNRMHLAFYRKFDHDVLYQTSNGTGTNLMWHIVPRSASADGHGDIKGYLDERWPGILGMAANFTRADIGWYYWFKDVRPDQLEYVCAKAMGVDGSISLETSQTALEGQVQSRQLMDTIRKWEQCRRADPFSAAVKAKLREPKHDFKLFADAKGGWQLYRAKYEEPRVVDVLDGRQNTWTIHNDVANDCELGVEIVSGRQPVAASAYNDPAALKVESFTNAADYQMSDRNQYEKFVEGGGRVLSATGPVREGVTQSFEVSQDSDRGTDHCLVYSAVNKGAFGGWSGIGRRFDKPLDLTGYKGLGLWVRGDAKYEVLRIQLRDSAGRNVDFQPAIDFAGWRLLTFPFPTTTRFNWAQTEYLLFYFNAIPANASVSVALDGVRAFRDLPPTPPFGIPVLTVNGRKMIFPVSMSGGQALTADGPGGVTFWPGGMAPGKKLTVATAALKLKPGDNTVTFSTTTPDAFSGNVAILLYRLWPMEK